jgi:hypothetical protein
MSKPPTREFVLRRRPPPQGADRHADAPIYTVELTRFGARVRVERRPPGGRADGSSITSSPTN